MPAVSLSVGNYEKINDALNAVLLSGRFQGRPLYLVLDNVARAELAEALDVPENEVENYCCREVGRSLDPHGDPYAGFAARALIWRSTNRFAKPPISAVLFTLAHAAERMVSDTQFTAANYYKRLEEITGVGHGRLSQHGVSTERFWQIFSSWLTEVDYAFGRPTARPLNSYKYVSIAISQAVVRASDRECFHKLFEKFSFSGTDAISGDEMYKYLDPWMHGSGPTSRLKSAWTKLDLRQRICEVALAELDEWTNSVRESRIGQSVGTNRLSLAGAIIPSFPKPSFLLSIGRKAELSDELSLIVNGRSGQPAVQIGNSIYGGFATLSPTSALDMQAVLSAGIALSDAGRGTQYSWRPRFAIPLARAESGNLWTEVQRTAVGVEYILLVRSTLKIRQSVERVLNSAARAGFTVATKQELPGLPPEWVLYQNVVMMRAFNDVPDDIAALSPLSDSGSLQVLGGLPLARGIWHRRAPPTLRLDAAEGPLTIEVRDEKEGRQEVVATTTATQSPALLQLTTEQIPASGALDVTGFAGKHEVGHVNLLMRSARRPLPLDRKGRGQLRYMDLATAREESAHQTAVASVEGLRASGPRAPIAESSVIDRFSELAAGGEAEDATPKVTAFPAFERRATGDVATFLSMSCGERGGHHWKAETLPAGYPARLPASMECVTCGETVLTRNRGTAPQLKTKDATTVRPSVPCWSPKDLTAKGVTVDHDLLLDALCFIGNGSWGTFESLVDRNDLQPWEAVALARNLAALGHIDLQVVKGSGRIMTWCVPPPTLAFHYPRSAVFSGFRNCALLDEARDLLVDAGATFEEQKRWSRPTRVLVQGIDPEAADRCLSAVKDALGRPIAVIENSHLRLAEACGGMNGLGTLLTPVSSGRPDSLQRFDLASGKWRDCEALNDTGAYRYQFAGQSYVYRDKTGRDFQGPHEIVKLLAARSAGAALHCYSPSSLEFVSMLGCEPPGLLARTLTACSGELPIVTNGRLVHGQVPPTLAATVLRILYDKEILS